MEPHSPPPLPAGHPASTDRPRFRPVFFFSFLFGPALLTLVGILALGADAGIAAAMILAVAGSLVGGIVCGIHLATCQTSLSTGGKVGLGIATAIGCVAASFALSFGGCLLGASIGETFL